MSQHHLTPHERMKIQTCLELGMKQADIARHLNRHPSIICREIKRNGRAHGRYKAASAQQHYQERRSTTGRKVKLDNEQLRTHVETQLRQDFSPEQIAGRLLILYPQERHMRISHESIYQYIYSDKNDKKKLRKHLRRGHRTRQKRGNKTTRRGIIKDRVSIDERPAIVESRKRIGDWEGDTMCGKGHKSHISTFTERRSGKLCIGKMQDKSAASLNQSAKVLANIPSRLVRTLTVDNGKEFAGFKTLEVELGAKVYFAHPYSSWERGTNENTNGLIRQYLPKGTDFRELTQEELDSIAEHLNNRPRKRLNYRTPNEVFLEAVAVDS